MKRSRSIVEFIPPKIEFQEVEGSSTSSILREKLKSFMVRNRSSSSSSNSILGRSNSLNSGTRSGSMLKSIFAYRPAFDRAALQDISHKPRNCSMMVTE